MIKKYKVYIILIFVVFFISCKKGNWCNCTSETTNFQGTNTVYYTVNLDVYEGGNIKSCSDLNEVTDTTDNKTDSTTLKTVITCKPR